MSHIAKLSNDQKDKIISDLKLELKIAHEGKDRKTVDKEELYDHLKFVLNHLHHE